MMADVILILILLVLVGAAIAYIVKAKKSGVKCIGCPVESCGGIGGCSGSCGGNCGGSCHKREE